MTIIKIEPHENGAHDNQTINNATPGIFPIPLGWAVIPEEIGTPETLENYPFGEILLDDSAVYPPMVIGWTPLPVPEPASRPEEPAYTTEDLLSALLGN